MSFLDKMKIKLNNFSKHKQLLLLDVLDFLVDKGNMNIWTCISSKKFFQSLLNLLKTKEIPEVQMKLLGLIQKWGLNFEDKKNVLPNFFNVYNKLRSNNVQFPSDFESNYQIYISESNNNNNYSNKMIIIIITTTTKKKYQIRKMMIMIMMMIITKRFIIWTV